MSFSLETKMTDVESKFPFSRSILQSKFHLGGCASCGYEPHESIAEVAQKHNKDATAIVATLNEGLNDMQQSEISVETLADLQKTHAELLLIDVREDWEFELCKLPGAVLLGQNNMDEIFKKASQSKHVVAYCHHGMRSLNAAMYMRSQGINHVMSLRGGIEDYSIRIDTSIPRY